MFTSRSRSRSYSVRANRITDFSQTVGSASTKVAYSHNANGDMTGDGPRSYTYDAEGRLSTATTGATDKSPTTRYAHNALGQRVFKTEPQYPPAAGDENDARFMQSLVNFFKQPWSPGTRPSETYGYVYAYDEQGSLIGEYGTGGAHSSGNKQYVYLPTAAGPMPIVVMTDDTRYAIVADHLNTPRRATHPDGGAMWQWGYSAFGDEQPTVAGRRFNKVAALESDFGINLRYPGQYFDVESGLHYNYFRSYNATTGRYTQPDPIGLAGGWNRFGYVDANPMRLTDPLGLMGGGSPQGRANGAPNVNAFGCMGIACITGGMEPTSMSAELSFGGGIEICDPPLPPLPESPICSRYDKNVQVQPPGIPVPEGGASRLTMRGGLFFGPSFKRDGRFCLRLGPHYSVPGAPSIDPGEKPL